MRKTAVLMLAMALAGCQQVSEMSYTQYRDLAVQKNKDCAAQGVKPGSKEMEACVTHEMRRETVTRENNFRRQMAVSSAMQSVGDGYSASAASYGRQSNSSIRCTTTPRSTFVGGTPSSYSTSCY